MSKELPAQAESEENAGRAVEVPAQVTARGSGAVAAGAGASYNATAKGATVNDNRVYVNVTPPATADAAQLSAADEEADLRAYAAQLRALYGRLDLEVLIPTTEGEHPRMELREVFVPPMLRADPPRMELPVELYRRLVESGELDAAEGDPSCPPGMDRRQWEQARQAYRERPAVALLDTVAAADATRVVLLGDPGAGKSTVARYLALTLVSEGGLEGPLKELAGLLPVVVELRRYAEADWRDRSFEDFLAHLHEHEGHAPSPALLQRRLRDGRALVVFDGLDELFDPRVRETVTRRITGFTSRYPRVRTVITSRVIGYRRHLLDTAGFRHYMIQSLDDAQIETFAKQWYAAAGLAERDGVERLHTRLIEAVARSRPVRELAGNPLLLTILAIIARRQRLPRDRAGVYQHAVNVLIAHWDEDTKHLDLDPGVRAIADLDDRDRREMLERLARHMQSGDRGIAGNHVLAEDVEKVFTGYLQDTLGLRKAPATTVARAMVSQFRERNFILSRYGSEVYGFVHRAFLEYLAASDIVRRYEQRELSDRDLLDDVFRKRAPDPDWHEVLLLIVAQTGEHFAAQAVDTILDLEDSAQVTEAAPPAVLALRALAEVRRIGRLNDQSVRTAKALQRCMEGNYLVQGDAGQDVETSLSLLGHAWAGARHLLRWLHVAEDHRTYPCGALLADKDALRTIAVAAPLPSARSGALYQLATRWADDEPVRAFIKDRAVHESDPDVRTEILYDVVEAWSHTTELRDFLHDRALHDPRGVMRRTAHSLLMERWGGDPETQVLIRSTLSDDAQEEELREGVLHDLASRGRGTADDSLRDLLTGLAAHDPSDGVRTAAQSTLAVGFGDQPAVREFLMARVTADPSASVRGTALSSLASWCDDSPEVRQAVSAHARESGGGPVRLHAVQAFVATRWNSGSDARALIKHWAAEDPDLEVRGAVLVALRGIAREDLDARSFLIERLSSEADPELRQVIPDHLAYLDAEPQVLRALQNSAVKDPDHQCRAVSLVRLSQIGSPSDTVRCFIATLARDDSSDVVRRAAQRCLESFWPSSPPRLPPPATLRRRVLEDTSESCFAYLLEELHRPLDPEVRVAAAQLLATCWATDSRTVPALTERAGVEEDPDSRALIEAAVTTATVYAPVHDLLF
ncbi:HEAT repeat domain-containing protein [Streptomyces griseoluteus]|uniref:HEAT repeat domain-containing protein n=1 Tax=Streptomyces griseoluteus TaxID=29306 RepID=UPI00381C6DED